MEGLDFLTWEELTALHVQQLQLYGGREGFIDEGVARSVLSRAQFTSQYDPDADIADLASDYMYGFATTQGFVDGNKRTASVSALYFLRKNGWDMIVTEKLMHVISIAVANGHLDRDALADILRDHMVELE